MTGNKASSTNRSKRSSGWVSYRCERVRLSNEKLSAWGGAGSRERAGSAGPGCLEAEVTGELPALRYTSAASSVGAERPAGSGPDRVAAHYLFAYPKLA